MSVIYLSIANALAAISTLSWQDPMPRRAPLMADPQICFLSRGPYCILGGEGEMSILRRSRYSLIRIRYEETGQPNRDILVKEPVECERSLSIKPYIFSISRHRSFLSVVFRLNHRCDITVSTPDHHNDIAARGIVIALTQIQMCMSAPCEGRPLATLISRRALGWPD
jgi:hypothetical protein